MKRWAAARFLAAGVLACALAASCVQEAEPGDAQSSAGAEPTATGEPTGKVRELLPVVSYSPEDFRFVTVIPDDGKEQGGGWQQARATLDFKQCGDDDRPRRRGGGPRHGLRSPAGNLLPEVRRCRESSVRVEIPWARRKGHEVMAMNRSELLEVVYRFYPRGVFPYERRHVPPGEPVYDDTEEHRRLLDAAARARAEYPTWKAMISSLSARYSLQNESLHLLAGGPDPAYSARIYLPGETGEITLTFHVCILGLYYGVHRTGDPGEVPAASEIAREIEVAYPGYEPIPPEIGDHVVPDVGATSGPFGEATIHELLFSEVWRWAGVRKPAP